MADKEENFDFHTFTFSQQVATRQLKDIELRANALSERIDSILNRVELNGMPVLKYILTLSHETEPLERVGKALLRIAPLLAEQDTLENERRPNAASFSAC